MIMMKETITSINDRLQLVQPEGGLPFGTDALLLAGFMRRMKNASGAELGAGSGVISLLLLTREKLGSSLALEIQPVYCEAMRRNASLNGLEGRLFPTEGDVTDYRSSEKFDVVFANPPYLAVTGVPSPDLKRQTARQEVAGGIVEFCRAASRLLKYGGLFYVVYRPERLGILMEALRDSRIEPKRMTLVYEDAAHAPCLVLTEGKLGASPGLYMTPPFFIHSGGGYSAEYEYQYENGDFDERYYTR